ncbi:MAG TPA: hypothetical protein VFI15_10570, partial [Candidatus Limnocylindrales bacterium]|nr:hypothetical protein [Candidatus Limnocylindrales bacterium]
GTYVTTSLFKEQTGITASDDDTLIGKVADRVNAFIEGPAGCGQVLAPLTSATYLYDGDGGRYLFLPTPPASAPAIGGLRATTLVEVKPTTDGTFETLDSGDYFLRSRAPGVGPYRYLLLSDTPVGTYTSWPKGIGTVRITGTAGWAAIPDDITQMALGIMQRWWNQRQSGYQTVGGVDASGLPIVDRFLALPDYQTLKGYRLRREQVIG